MADPPPAANPTQPKTFEQLLREGEQRWEKGELAPQEIFWRDHYSWLKDSGYLLQSRYSPDWTPSWKSRRVAQHSCEDGIKAPFSVVAEATRISDGSRVLIKKIDPISNDASPVFHEDRVLRKFSSEPLASDPKNRCIRLIEMMSVPDDPKLQLGFMPFYYAWDLVPFGTVGEVVDFLSQIIEGLQFMHSSHVWHGDVKWNNVLMDASPLLVDDVNPWKPHKTRDLTRDSRFRPRLRHPVRYYLIDFDLSGVHDPSDGPPAMIPRYGGTRGVPEFKNEDQPCDPFAVDVWCLGNLIKEFTQGDETGVFKEMRSLEFLHELVTDMLCEDPTTRPNMDEVARRFSEIQVKLRWWNLRARFARVDENLVIRVFKSTTHWTRQLYYTTRRVPAIPTP